MDKMYRLRNNMEFRKVYNKGKNYWNRNLVLFVKKNNLGYTRVGYTITKKVGNSVVRNRIRRQMKEIYRLNFDRIEKDYDLIFIPKKSVVDISFIELESAMIHIMKISRLIKKESGKSG